MKKIFIYFITGLIIFLLTVLTAFYLLLSGSLPEYQGTILSEHLQDSVFVYFDRMGIANIEAAADPDLWYVLGWLHARERLFQMEVTRRVAAGRLAEMFGAEVLEIDRLQRLIGHSRMAEQDVSNLSVPTRERLYSYITGINDQVKQSPVLPFEFYLLNQKFEEWDIQDCLTIFSFQTWYSDYLQNNDALYLSIEKEFGRSRAAELQAEYPPWAPTSVLTKLTAHLHQENSNLLLPGGLTNASNAWAFAPQRSASGSAMLASDPHLDIYRLPQFWYAVGLHCRESGIEVFGVTTPGLPFMAYGHNGKAAWAFTAGGVDVMDFYSEELDAQDPSGYKTATGWAEMEEIQETIKVSGADTAEHLLIRKTAHGPVIEQNDSLNLAYSFHWAGFDISLAETMDYGFKLVTVAEFDTFRAVITRFGALNASWVFAGKSGTIGYQLGTPVPVRNYENSQFVLPGADPQYEWKGFHTLENTPHTMNPPRGWVASCNNKPAAHDLLYPLPGNFAADRILRISKLLEIRDKFSTKDMRDFQYDYVSEYMLRWKSSAIDVLRNLEQPQLAADLNQWNGDFSSSGQAAALIQVWLFYLKKLTFEDELQSQSKEVENPHMFRDLVMEKIFFNGPDTWFDDIRTADTVESKQKISEQAMRMAMAETEGHSWPELQQLKIGHPFAQNPLLDLLLNLSRGPFNRGGTNTTLNASTSVKDRRFGFRTLVGPSMRLVIDFADIDQTSVVFPAGQSGHPLSNHFFDFYDLWSTGRVWTVPFSMTAIKDNAASVLKFLPEQN